jgi:hypothetical protein
MWYEDPKRRNLQNLIQAHQPPKTKIHQIKATNAQGSNQLHANAPFQVQSTIHRSNLEYTSENYKPNHVEFHNA